jgi:hypothetical protein
LAGALFATSIAYRRVHKPSALMLSARVVTMYESAYAGRALIAATTACIAMMTATTER